MDTERYPENRMTFAPEYGHGETEIPENWQWFFDLREDLLLGYGHNTARAYWADLDDWFRWAIERDKDVLELTEKDKRHCVALLRRRGYSENPIRRRLLSISKLETNSLKPTDITMGTRLG